MAIGFVLVHAAPAHEHKVYTKLSKVSEVVEVHPLFGEYDLIVKVEPEDFEKLGDIVESNKTNDTGDRKRKICPFFGTGI